MADLEILLYSEPGEGFDDEETLTGTEDLVGKSNNNSLSTSVATRAYQGSQLSDPGTHTGGQDLSLVSVGRLGGVDTTPPLISTHTSSQAFSRKGRGEAPPTHDISNKLAVLEARMIEQSLLHEKQLSLILYTIQGGKRPHHHTSDAEHSAHSNFKRGKRRFTKTGLAACAISSSSSSEDEQPPDV